MDASPKDKFDAAVTVIQTIPRNVSMRDAIRLIGSFQPSNSLMLKFYAYYKQATVGPCDVSRPAFYDVVGKAKWDAWDKLENMSPKAAMESYVDELKNIIEAMPHTSKVQEFVSKLGDFYELVDEEQAEQFRRIKPALHLNGDIPSHSVSRSESGGSRPDESESGGSRPDESESGGSRPDESESGGSRPDESESGGSSPVKSSSEPGSMGSSTEIQFDQDDLVTDPSITFTNDRIKDNEIADESNGLGLLIKAMYSIENFSCDLEKSDERTPLRLGNIDKLVSAMNGHVVVDRASDTDIHLVSDHTEPLGSDVRTRCVMSSDDDSDADEFCDTTDIAPQETFDSLPVHHADRGYAIPTEPTAPALPRDMSSANLGLGPNQLTDRNWSSFDLIAMETQEERGDALMMRGGDQVDRGGEAVAIVTFPRNDSGNSLGSQSRGRVQGTGRRSSDVSEQLSMALSRLQQDMTSVITRLDTLETLSATQQRASQRTQTRNRSQVQTRAWWWPFSNMPGRTIFFLVVWPFIVHWFLSRRRRHNRP